MMCLYLMDESIELHKPCIMISIGIHVGDCVIWASLLHCLLVAFSEIFMPFRWMRHKCTSIEARLVALVSCGARECLGSERII